MFVYHYYTHSWVTKNEVTRPPRSMLFKRLGFSFREAPVAGSDLHYGRPRNFLSRSRRTVRSSSAALSVVSYHTSVMPCFTRCLVTHATPERRPARAQAHIGVLSVASDDDRPHLTVPLWYGCEPAAILPSSSERKAGRPTRPGSIEKRAC